jgi:hypothetical protein
MRLIIPLLLMSFSFTELASQTRIERRIQKDILRFKGNDSAWIAQGWGATRFYLGNKAVSLIEFENTIKGYNFETEALISKARKSRKTALFYEIGGLSLMLFSAFTVDPNRSTRYDNETLKTSTIVLFSSGIAVLGIGAFYQLNARNKYIDGIGEFNKSVKETRGKATVGLQPNGFGFGLHF